MKKATKKDVYADFGIEYKDGKIFAPEFGWIPELLVNGNSKLGKGVWTFSTLPSNLVFSVIIKGKKYEIKGTCPCNCDGCYAQKGFHNMPSTIRSNAIKTYLARNYLEFVKNAIIAQIISSNIKLVRIHESGDFFCDEYVVIWREIVTVCGNCLFWGYTKNIKAENSFNDLNNVNIVKSIIKGFGFNFGKCEYLINLYNTLVSMGKKVHICKCGIDKNQHCTNCKGCVENEFVLFIEHSTGYNAEKDPFFPILKEIIENQ